ncbi:hypothetical protein [Pseudomonas sp. A34-9]|nr:hypothetical protein [Pseudomonas sp. A34-9]
MSRITSKRSASRDPVGNFLRIGGIFRGFKKLNNVEYTKTQTN